MIEPHFVRKGCDWTPRNCNFTAVFADRPSFRAKRLRLDARNRNFTSVFGDRTSFRSKGLHGNPGNDNFTSVFGDRTSFRAKLVAIRRLEIAILRQFLAIEPHFVRKGCDWTP